MNTAIIDLNDAGIRLCLNHDIVADSPGYAVITPDELVLGNQAVEQARLHPLQTNSQFWNQLSLEPVQSSNTLVRHHADLAFAHLSELHQQFPFEQAVFAVPAHYSHEQLSLLLGITQECPFNTVGLIDSAVATAAPYTCSGTSLYIDIQLHQTVISQIVTDDSVKRQRVEIVPGIGLMQFYDRWAKMLADEFIQQTRFDPLHHAATEQALFNQLPQWVSNCQKGRENLIELERKSISLAPSAWVKQVQPLYDQLTQAAQRFAPETGTHLFCDRAQMLPQLEQLWPGAILTSKEALVESCRQHQALITGEPGALNFVTQLPASETPRLTPATTDSGSMRKTDTRDAHTRTNGTLQTENNPQNDARHAALHILWDCDAYPLEPGKHYLNFSEQAFFTQEPDSTSWCALERSPTGIELHLLNDQPIYLNGEMAESQRPVQPGDTLGLSAQSAPKNSVKLIRVRSY